MTSFGASGTDNLIVSVIFDVNDDTKIRVSNFYVNVPDIHSVLQFDLSLPILTDFPALRSGNLITGLNVMILVPNELGLANSVMLDNTDMFKAVTTTDQAIFSVAAKRDLTEPLEVRKQYLSLTTGQVQYFLKVGGVGFTENATVKIDVFETSSNQETIFLAI